MPTHMNHNLRIVCTIAAALYFLYCLVTPADWHFIDGVDLIFHEAGHTIFAVFDMDFLAVAGGTIMQLLMPLVVTLNFIRTQQRLSAVFSLMWVGQNMANVSVYAGDAQHMALPLLGGDGVIHDWNYMLSALSVLKYTNTIATFIYMLAVLCVLSALGYALYALFCTEKRTG